MSIQNYVALLAATFILASTPSLAADVVSLSIKKDGSVVLNNKQISLEELAVLAAAESRKDKHSSIHVVAEKDISAETIAAVMNTCRKAGINRITISESVKKKE